MENRPPSKLGRIGVLLLVFGFFGSFGFIVEPLGLTAVLLIDLFRLCLFAGIALIVIGWLQNRRRSSNPPA